MNRDWETVYVCLYVCDLCIWSICMCVLMCRCEPVDAHVKTRRWCLVYTSVTSILLFEIGPLSEPDAHQPANLLASQQSGDQAVSTSLPSAGITGMLCHSWLFTWVLESLTSDPHEYTASTFPPSNLFSLWIVCVNRD